MKGSSKEWTGVGIARKGESDDAMDERGRAMMRWIVALALLFVGCGAKEVRDLKPNSYRTNELAVVLDAAASWAIATKYEGAITFEEGTYPNQGNANLWHGLMCWVGDPSSCDLVASLECSDHSLKRAPWRVCGDYSRDELLGHLLAQLTTRKKTALPGSFPFTVSPEMWFAAWRVGYPDRSMGKLVDQANLQIEAANNPLNYQSHLVAVHLLLRKSSGLWNGSYQGAANKLASRQPQNLFYRWLANGTSQGLVDSFLAIAPRTRPAAQRFWIWQEPDINGRIEYAHGSSIAFMSAILLWR
jgi:hypothetical protein